MQIENGVGMLRSLITEFDSALRMEDAPARKLADQVAAGDQSRNINGVAKKVVDNGGNLSLYAGFFAGQLAERLQERLRVGKSALFNKLVGQRISIVEDTPGVTRDRIYGETDWNGRKFTLIDTGGIEPRTDNEILLFMREQAGIAISHADVIVLSIKTYFPVSFSK